MRIKSGGQSDTDPKVYRELNAVWKKHIDLYQISLTAYIHEQSSSGMSDLLFAEKVGSPSYVVPIDYSAYENIDF